MERHGEHHAGATPRDAAKLGERPAVVFHVLYDVEGTHEIERPIAVGERGDVAQGREAAALPQPRERRCTDVDEVRAAHRQPRTQTRTDLEPSGRRGSTHGKFRPRIEAMRGDQVPRRPERVVEATIGGPYPTAAS